MADVKIALEELKEQADSETLPRSRQFLTSKRKRVYFWGAAFTVLLSGGMAMWMGSLRSPIPASEDLTAVPLTTYLGFEEDPSFSPDGTQVAFSWCPVDPSNDCHIYIKQLGVEPPFRLTNATEVDLNPVWSPDGQVIAFLRMITPTRWALMVTPQRGGRERVLDERERQEFIELPGPYLAWTPDSKWIAAPMLTGRGAFALSLISLESGEKRSLTSPPAGTRAGDTAPAFSPDGRSLTFTRVKEEHADLYLLRLGPDYRPRSEPMKLSSPNLDSIGAVWTPNGREVVYSSGTESGRGLWRLSPWNSAVQRRLAFAPDATYAPSISRQGNRLAYAVKKFHTNIWRVTLPTSDRNAVRPKRWIASTRSQYYPSYSPDGTRIAFMSKRSGANEIWMCDADGSNPVQLTSTGEDSYGPRWSPDGGNVVYTSVTGGKSGIYAVSAKGGKPRPLITRPDEYQWPFWSRNGKWLYFTSTRAGSYEISKMLASGGEVVQLTHYGGDHPEESPDGKMIYYGKGYPNVVSVWRVPADGGEEVKVIDSVHTAGQWTVGRRGIYFFSGPDKQGLCEIRLYEFTSGHIKKLLTIDRPVSFAIAVSPENQAILYTQVDEAGSELMLVENFR